MTSGGKRRVIVVGAGMGGLAAAVDLASAGEEVVLLERSARPGGKVRSEQVDGDPIDAGPTVFTLKSVFLDLFERAGADFDDLVPNRPLSLLARHGWIDGSRLDLFSSVDRTAEAIGDFAGAPEARAYRAFARDARTVFENLEHTFMRREKPGLIGLSSALGPRGLMQLLVASPFRSLWGELGRRFQDPRLRQLFGRYATYCGSSPFQSPSTLMLIAHAEQAGVWTIEGGLARLAAALAALAERQGVTVRFNAPVHSIDTGPRGVTGVRLADGEVVEGEAVVFNGDCRALGLGLLGDAVRTAVAPRPDDTRSLSAVTWCLKGRIGGFPLAHHTVLFGDDYPTEFSDIFQRGEVVRHPTVYLCAQDRGAGDRPHPERERLFLLVNAPPRDLTKAESRTVQKRSFEWLERHGLEIDADEDTVTTIPNDFADRFPGSDGALYGWPTHGWRGSFQRPGSDTSVPGLFLAGGTVHPGPGVPMAALSGRLAARRVLDHLGVRT